MDRFAARGVLGRAASVIRFHFRTRVLIALANCRVDALGQSDLGFVGAIILREHLRKHLVTGHVVWIRFQQGSKVGFRGRQIAFADAFERDAVARKSVVRVAGQKVLKLLTPGLLLVGHGSVPYYTCSTVTPKEERKALCNCDKRSD
jgi:hypothetical protein